MSDEIPNTATKPWAGRFGNSAPAEDQPDSYRVYLAAVTVETPGRTPETVAEYPTYEEALQLCRILVDTFLAANILPGMSGDELFTLYRKQGPDPYILCHSGDYSRMPCYFNAWYYAETACRKQCGEPPGEPSRLLGGQKGRYREYDRLRMTAQLLLHRKVRVLQDHSGVVLEVPAGSEGHIGLGSPYISGREFDFTVELPVIFARKAMDAVTFGVPYELLECISSDDEHLDAVKNPCKAS